MMQSHFFEDVRHGFRSFRNAPGFAAIAILALGLGIGSTTAIFSVVNAVLLRPLPYPDAGRIALLQTAGAASPVKFNFLRAHTDSLVDMAAYRFGRANLTGVDNPEQIRSAQVTADYFRLFGQSVAPGRPFTAAECLPGGTPVVVLGRAFWERAFGGDPRTVGRSISLGGKPYEVIGIMTGDSEIPATDPSAARMPVDVWMPFLLDPASHDQSGYFTVAARLKPGISLEGARAQLRVATGEFRRAFPTGIDSQSEFSAVGIREGLVAGAGSSLSIFAWAVTLVLLIACANVASLQFIRAAGRKREIAIRAALGAGRGRIVRQLLAESLLLAAGGGAVGFVLGLAGIRVLLALNAIGLPRIGDHGSAVTADWRVLAFTALVSVATCVLSGVVPALNASRADLSEALKGGSRLGIGFRDTQARALLVLVEVAVAVVLLTGAGLLIRTFVALRSVNPGFDPRHVLTMRVSLSGAGFQKAAAVADLVRASVARISALPGVVSAASTCCLPLEDNLIGGVEIVGRPRTGQDQQMVDVVTISPAYFDVFRIPLERGRAFSDRDLPGTAPVVIVNEAMARRFWPGDDTLTAPLEASLTFPDVPPQPWRIVGIVGDVHAYGLSQGAPSIVYLPVAQAPEELSAYIVRNPIAWTVRTGQEGNGLRLAIRRELSQASGGLAVSGIQTMDEILSQSTAGREFNMWLLTSFGCCALLLASLGIYGLMAWSVQLRTREIGVRMALGAETGSVRRMMILQGMRIALMGVAFGSLAASGLTRLLAGFLFGVKARDPVVFVLAPAVLTAVALLAVWLPACRASRIDPLEALRHE